MKKSEFLAMLNEYPDDTQIIFNTGNKVLNVERAKFIDADSFPETHPTPCNTLVIHLKKN